MDFKKIKLGTEERKRLLQMIAEEEQRLGSQDLSEDELAEEERLLSEQLGRLLASETAESSPKSPQDIVSTSSENAKIDHWQQLKEKIDDLNLASEKGGLLTCQDTEPAITIPFSRKPTGTRQKLMSTRKYQMGTLLAAAAVLMMVYVLIPQSPVTGPVGPSDFRYKGTADESDTVQLGDDRLICDYRIILRQKSDPAVIREAEVSDDQASYLTEPDQSIQLASKCLAKDAYVHGMFVPNQGVTSGFYNQKLVANQWNLVPPTIDDQWILGSGEGRIILFMTMDKIDESRVSLPTEIATSIGEASVVEFQEITLKLDQK